MSEDDVPGGAYGFAVAGLTGVRELLVPAPAHWTPFEIAVELSTETGPGDEHVNESRAEVRLTAGGWVTLDRVARRAVFSLAYEPPPAALVHPHLAAVGAVESHWQGRESFHAGAFVAGGGVWGLLGEKGAGKSSMLGSLAAADVPIVCDDLLVIDDGTAMAGPRSIDLRTGAAEQLGLGVALGRIGERDRWRVSLAPVPPELPFRGWVELRWSDRVAIQPKQGSERLRALVPHRALRMAPARPQQLVHLAALPVLELYRPQRWDSHEEAIEVLLDALAAGG